jgi:hypothetical protein
VWPRIREHKIAEWTVAYVAFAFVALHGATLLSDALEWPHAIVRLVTFLLILGFPIVPILAWYHGVRALKRVHHCSVARDRRQSLMASPTVKRGTHQN